mmetsp:Transcript_15098/g.43509  ORF Transcript_15098/g.43509 Transcript_15098/m.43509 type:complete len:206 (+) Transcript_15098:277-894(+)
MEDRHPVDRHYRHHVRRRLHAGEAGCVPGRPGLRGHARGPVERVQLLRALRAHDGLLHRDHVLAADVAQRAASDRHGARRREHLRATAALVRRVHRPHHGERVHRRAPLCARMRARRRWRQRAAHVLRNLRGVARDRPHAADPRREVRLATTLEAGVAPPRRHERLHHLLLGGSFRGAGADRLGFDSHLVGDVRVGVRGHGDLGP